MTTQDPPKVRGEAAVKAWYSDYYARTGGGRNDLLSNPGVLFQILAMERAFIRAVRSSGLKTDKARVLDVGCGGGGNTYQLLRLGIDVSSITGIDVQPERLEAAKKTYPGGTWTLCDASHMRFEDNEFDLVTEFTMFATLPDDDLSAKIAAEMVRVCKPDAYIVLVDWRTPKPGDPNYRALTRARLTKMFRVDESTELIAEYKGALVPPLGRVLSAYLPSLYFLIAALCPLLVGQVAYLLRKKAC